MDTITREDSKYLHHIGHNTSEVKQIDECIPYTKFVLTEQGKKPRRITSSKAIEVLGRTEFLNGMSRCAFHVTTSRSSNDCRYRVEFDTAEYFE
jgi:hypothetical protein